MKNVTPAMAAHLAQGSTTLTTCWKITRTDGQQFFYTELDKDIEYDGNTYRSAAGFNKSAIKSTASFSVDELEVAGFLRDDGIADTEIRNGAFDYAQVEVFMINYMDVSMGIIKLRAGIFGEVRTASSGAFVVELRGLVDMLQQKIGRTYLPECDVDLGSPKCGIPLVAPERESRNRYEEGQRVTYPVLAPRFIPDRNYKALIDPNMSAVVSGRGVLQTANVIMEPYQGPKVIRITKWSAAAEDDTPLYVNLSDMDISSGDAGAATYRVTVTGRYFVYSGHAHAAVTLRQQTISGSNLGTASRTELRNVRPDRRWRKFKVSIVVDNPACGRIAFWMATGTSVSGQVASVCYDDLNLVVSAVAKEELGFQHFGGVEYECIQAGTTAGTAPVFTDVIDDEIADGTVIWKVVWPKWTYLGTVNHDAVRSDKIDGNAMPVPGDFFDWGVLKFLTGENAGRAIEVRAFNNATGEIWTALPLPYQSKAGDIYSIQVGCDKRLSTCKARFGNQLNFRGFNRMPGQGQYFKVAGMH